MTGWRMKSLFTVVTLCFIAASNAYAGGNWEQFQDPQSAARGNCPECQPGEAKAETAVIVRHGVYVDINDLPCGDARLNTPGLPAEIKPALATAFYNQLGPGAKFAIDLGEAGINGGAGTNALLQAGLYDAGTVGQRLRSWTTPLQVANCTRLALVLPKSVTITRIEKGRGAVGAAGHSSRLRARWIPIFWRQSLGCSRTGRKIRITASSSVCFTSATIPLCHEREAVA